MISIKTISEIGVKEKYIRRGHYNTIKTWWARRPIIAMRCLLMNEIFKRTNSSSFDKALLYDINPPQEYFEQFNIDFATSNISVLDVFSGGGAIPFESARLGFKTFSSELNPVASLLQETIFNAQKIDNYSDKLRVFGDRIINKTEARLKKYYKVGEDVPYVIFWGKIARCKKCNNELSLRRLQYLSKKQGKVVRIEENRSGGLELKYNICDKGSNKDFRCKECGYVNSFNDIKEYCKNSSLKSKAFAICVTNDTRSYRLLTDNDINEIEGSNHDAQEEIEKLKKYIPNEMVKSRGGVINPTLYDLKKTRDFFNNRQLLVLLTLIDETVHAYKRLKSSTPEIELKQLVLGATSLIEFLVDWNSVSTMWISQNQQSGRSLAGPGVGMKWDYIEINPFNNSGSTLRSKLNRVCDSLSVNRLTNTVNINNGSSTNLPIDSSSIDIILTDPPYYDSIDYTGLSEFFRPWFEVLIKHTYDTDIDLKNNVQQEAIVELSNKSSRNYSHYKEIMTDVLHECNRVLNASGSILLLYSHKTIEGWKVIAEALKDVNLFIDECYPIEMERIARPRAMSHDALNGVIVFRIKKNKDEIKSVESDIKYIRQLIENDNLLDSQVVIYLAALSCKKYSLEEKSNFLECYEAITKLYSEHKMANWDISKIDSITKAYLEVRIDNELINSTYYQNILNTHKLINKKRIKTLEDIQLEKLPDNTLLKGACTMYNTHRHNTATKISIGKSEIPTYKMFFSVLSGTGLNTVKSRSSKNEVKTARLILSKFI